MSLFIVDLDDTLANTTKDLGLDGKGPISNLTLVDGAREFLKEFGQQTILLTTGKVRRQKQKMRVLGIENAFKEILIVATHTDKKRMMGYIVTTSRIPRQLCIVIGDRLDVEIEAGNRLGCKTVRMLLPGGKYIDERILLSEEKRLTEKNLEEKVRMRVPDYNAENFFDVLGRIPLLFSVIR